jgi:plasmid stabilization system protein ParE
MSNGDSDYPHQYAVRLSEVAEVNIESAFDFLFMRDPNFAYEWRRGLTEKIRGLSVMPRRYPLTRDSEQNSVETRRFLYEYHGIVYRVTYAISGTDGSDPLVRILRVRHGAREH